MLDRSETKLWLSKILLLIMQLICITETWLHPKGDDVTIGELCPSGYRFSSHSGPAGTGGGVGLLCKQDTNVPAFF